MEERAKCAQSVLILLIWRLPRRRITVLRRHWSQVLTLLTPASYVVSDGLARCQLLMPLEAIHTLHVDLSTTKGEIGIFAFSLALCLYAKDVLDFMLPQVLFEAPLFDAYFVHLLTGSKVVLSAQLGHNFLERLVVVNVQVLEDRFDSLPFWILGMSPNRYEYIF